MQQGDYKKAIAHFENSKENSFSLYKLGQIYLDKETPIYDFNKGMSFMFQSAQMDNSFAEMYIGIMNLKGENVKRDIKTARLWLGKSAEHRNEIASEILENMDNYSQKDIKIFAIRKSFIVSMSIQALRKSMKNEVERQKNIQEHERMITKNSDEID